MATKAECSRRNVNRRLRRSRRAVAEMLESRRLLSASSQAVKLFSSIPAIFVENQGQWANRSVRYMYQGNGGNVLISDRGPIFELYKQGQNSDGTTQDGPAGAPFPSPGTPGEGRGEGSVTQSTHFSVRFDGAKPVQPTGADPSSTSFNYFVGDQTNWRSNVSGFQTIEYAGLYKGIDLDLSGQRDGLKYEFHVAPGADYRHIRLSYDGIDGLSIDADGNLHATLGDGFGQVIDQAPVIYQMIGGQKVYIRGRFVLQNDHSYGFQITGRYDVNAE